MENNILGFVQAPNYVKNSNIVEAPVKQYIPYVYKCEGTYVMAPNGSIIERNNWDYDKPNGHLE
jgi:hypothetical protein